MDEADQGAPAETLLDDGDGSLPNGRPDAPQERFKADAMLIHEVQGPQLDPGLRVGGGDGLDERAALFLQASC